MKYLRERSIFHFEQVDNVGGDNRTVYIYAYYAPIGGLYETCSTDRDWVDDDKQPLYEPGIYLSTKGMPTGVRLEPPKTWGWGYWSNMVIIINDDTLPASFTICSNMAPCTIINHYPNIRF